MFYSLHNHTYASNIRFLDSINRPENMVKKAIELGFSGIAFTDHESLSAHVELLKIKDKIKEKNPDFKIIHGNEIYLIDENSIKNTKNYFHFILLAKDLTGWRQLCALSSKAWEREYVDRGVARVPTTYQDIEEIIGDDKGHLLCSTACLGGQLSKAILNHDVTEANNFIKWCLRTFGEENVALEIQPSDSEEQCLVNPVIIKLAKYYQIPFIVTTDSHYLEKDDLKIFSGYLNSKQSKDRETEKFYRFTYLMSLEEMKDILVSGGIAEEDALSAIENTKLIADKIEDFDFRHDTIVPCIKIPSFQLNYVLYHKGFPHIDQFYDSQDEQDRFLMFQIEQGLIEKNVTLNQEKFQRIDIELDVLWYLSENLKQKLSAYLNLTKHIIDIAWNVSLAAPGRGSSTGFYINYLIGIVQVDSMKYDLQYWRFLNKERVELPDVDSDFQPEKTADITKLLREEFGEDNVLNCATFKTEKLKSAILSCGRALEYNNDDMQALAALVPAKRGITYTLKDCLKGDEEKGLEPVPNFEESVRKYPGLFEAVEKIEGLPTNASIHASALYIFNNGYLAQNSLMRAPNGTKMTAFTMHDSDDQGALKMDVLRTDAQSKIAKCLDLLLRDNLIKWQGNLRNTYNKYIHPDVIDYESPEMWAQASDGKIPNLFQMETMVGSVCMKKTRPTDVMELARVNSIMRLQAENGEEAPIDRYVRIKNNPNLWDLEMLEAGLTSEEINILKKYLAKGYGVSDSQEVLMQILMDPKICNFTLKEANSARKAIAKKKADMIKQLKIDFYEKGAQTN